MNYCNNKCLALFRHRLFNCIKNCNYHSIAKYYKNNIIKINVFTKRKKNVRWNKNC